MLWWLAPAAGLPLATGATLLVVLVLEETGIAPERLTHAGCHAYSDTVARPDICWASVALSAGVVGALALSTTSPGRSSA